MARQRSNFAEDLIEVVSKLPWWVGIILAIVSYFIMHSLTNRPAVTYTRPDQMGAVVASGIINTIGVFGQIIFPFIFGFAALVSGINAIKQKKLYDKVESRAGVSALNEIPWDDFERLVGEYYKRNGFQVAREGGNGPDGGVDLVLRKNGEIYLVQCKQWKAYKVGVQPIREFYGVMTVRGAAGGYFVTSGSYTDEAQAFVRGLNLELIDGPKLRQMIDLARKQAAASTTISELQQANLAPTCPKCGAMMKKRVARQGANTGKEFWGCSVFPRCKGTRPVDNIANPIL